MFFFVSPLSEKTQETMKSCGMLDHAAALPFQRLREVFVRHYDFEGNIKKGSVIMLDVMAEDCRQLFEALYEKEFPIYSVKPICQFNADDNKSMDANNASAYNPRFIAGTNDLSVHSYGMALDINPVQNPYVKFGDMASHNMKIYPAAGKNYLNRAAQQKGMLEDVIPIFYKYGFVVWGGAWNERRIDYHHFQVPACLAILCTIFDYDEALKIYALYKENTDSFLDFPENKLSEFKVHIQTTLYSDILKQLKLLVKNKKSLNNIC